MTDETYEAMLAAWDEWWAAHRSGTPDSALWDRCKAAERAWEAAEGIPPAPAPRDAVAA